MTDLSPSQRRKFLERIAKLRIEGLHAINARPTFMRLFAVEFKDERELDRTLQRMRKRGEIEYAAGGWHIVVPMVVCCGEETP